MKQEITERFFNTRNALITSLSEDIAQTLTTWQKGNKRSGLILAGGTTPRPLYSALAQSHLHWPLIDLSLSDDRLVETGSKLSNEYFLQQDLLGKVSSEVRFFSLLNSPLNEALKFPQDMARLINDRTALNGLDTYAVLGMGSDGHIASLFPDCKNSRASLNQTREGHRQATAPLILTFSPVAPKRRISIGFSAITSWTKTVLLITGEDKKQRYLHCKNAAPDTAAYQLPVSYLLRSNRTPKQCNLEIYWAP